MDGITLPHALSLDRAGDDSVSVVIAAFNEAENVEAVALGVLDAFAGTAFELVFVDDGSDDGTAARLDALCAVHPEIRALRHDRNCGKTRALVTGAAAARGSLIVTMDADGQNDPHDARAMIEALRAAPDSIVAGTRARRRDKWSRRVATRLANRFRGAVLNDRCPDTGCGLKAFRRDAFLRLPAFEGMHRFLPALFQTYGHGLVCHPVSHRARMQGASKYTNWGRAAVGIVDLLGVIWLQNRTRRPGRVTESAAGGAPDGTHGRP
jgi:dolichol-phosphate mannosyltransferase